MGISGSDKALCYAMSGVERSGATRSNCHSPKVCISINGVQVGWGKSVAAYETDNLTISDLLNEMPNTATLDAKGLVPVHGQDVIVTLGSINNLDRLFAGKIISRDVSCAGTPVAANGRYTLNLIDPTWGLNKRKVNARYTSQTIATIAASLIANFTSGYTVSVDSAIGATIIDEISFTDQEVTDCLSQLAKRAGAYWKGTYHSGVRIYATETNETAPTDLTSAHASLVNPRLTYDLSSVVTRIWSDGGGVNALTEVAVGETLLPVEDLAWYNPTGGMVRSGPQRITYAGIAGASGGSLVGPGISPSSAPSVAKAVGAGIEDGVRQYAVVFVTGAGKSLPGPLASVTHGALAPPTGGYGYQLDVYDGGGPNDGVTIGAEYRYKFTYSTATSSSDHTQETEASAASNMTTPVALANWPYTGRPSKLYAICPGSTDPAVKWVHFYRTLANGSTYYHVAACANVAGHSAGVSGDSNGYDGYADAAISGNPTAPAVSTAVFNRTTIAGVPIGGTGVTQREIYRTMAGGSQLKLQQVIANNTATTGVEDTAADAALGGNAPGSDTSGLTQPDGQIVPGTTSVIVAGPGSFSTSGGWAVIGNGRQAIRYTGMSGNSLTGIPASGAGSIVATISYNSTITPAPVLTGIPASGTGSILYAIKQGDPVNLVVQVDDVTAQTDLAALIAGDGIQEDSISDNRLSQTEALARGLAQLALRKNVGLTLTYRCHDKNTRSGSTISVDLDEPFNLTADFMIQSVTISDFWPAIFPWYSVVASSTRFSFEDLLRMLRR
jgi:hypothetical protein